MKGRIEPEAIPATEDYDAQWAARRGLGSVAGWFYVIQLAPDVKPERLKFGYASDVASRLSGHRVSAPTAVLLRSYPVVAEDETPLIGRLTNERCTRLSAEAYDVESVERVLRDADALFAWADGLDRELYARLLRTNRVAVADYLRELQEDDGAFTQRARRIGPSSVVAGGRHEALVAALDARSRLATP